MGAGASSKHHGSGSDWRSKQVWVKKKGKILQLRNYRVIVPETRLGTSRDVRVFMGENVGVRDEMRGERVAMKIQNIYTETVAQLDQEISIYQAAASDKASKPWCARLKDFGMVEDQKVIVMELLGPSLLDLFDLCVLNKPARLQRFSIETVCVIGIEILRALKGLHKLGYVHCNLHPKNIVMSNHARSTAMFLIGFGHSRRFIDSGTHRHIPLGKSPMRPSLAKSAFCSLNAYTGVTQSCRDDLESLGYLLTFLATGTLPWSSNPREDGQSNTEIGMARNLKSNITIEDLCTGMPSQFFTYWSYVRGMAFDEQPDHRLLQELFRTVLTDNGHQYETFVPDWMTLSIHERRHTPRSRHR
eukprot:TRINITY_DN10622_c0_g1_i1.p1 TRINITY_DN10622_c0_g1~~TRINITY_DN10622_c0_g1_i1.p1  ORF type:complete len:359 (-),score=19.92 TRINITY_DN10622_c0_g1_i1:10-1086(-)